MTDGVHIGALCFKFSQFCFVMMDDGVKELGATDIEVMDISMILADRALE